MFKNFFLACLSDFNSLVSLIVMKIFLQNIYLISFRRFEKYLSLLHHYFSIKTKCTPDLCPSKGTLTEGAQGSSSNCYSASCLLLLSYLLFVIIDLKGLINLYINGTSLVIISAFPFISGIYFNRLLYFESMPSGSSIYA